MREKLTSLVPFAAAVAAALAWGSPGVADGPVNRVPVLELDIRPLSGPSAVEPRRLDVRPGRPSRLSFATDWDEVGEVGLELVAHAEPAGDANSLLVTLEALLTLPDGRRIEASRRAEIRQSGTILFELYRHGERPFTLVVRAALSETWEVVHRPSVGAPVRFEVEIERVEGPVRTSLERNLLHTFVNRTVRYEFQSGSELTDEALALSLTPLRLIEDLVEIKINVAGRLPAQDGMTVIARDENLVVNRGATHPLTVTVGEPPRGYRFQVTPRF
jgi:hypothetical protein